MQYRLRHYTHYNYAEPVDQAHNQLRMMLREVPNQRCLNRSIRVRPSPRYAKMHLDFFGNRVLYVEFNEPHTDARIFVSHTVDVFAPNLPEPSLTPAWEHVAVEFVQLSNVEYRQMQMYTLPSHLVGIPTEIEALVAPHFTTGKPVLQCAIDMAAAIYSGFEFNAKATSIATPLADVLKKRQGVCQDFAHLMIAGLRHQGLAARYVSGYIETIPPVGQPRMVGADASHAWVSVWCGEDYGWQDIDPTNNLRPTEHHITTAWGRDYDDVIPLNGVIFGGGKKSSLKVRVDVARA